MSLLILGEEEDKSSDIVCAGLCFHHCDGGDFFL